MSKLEIKGNILEQIAKLDDEKSLRELASIINQFVTNRSEMSDFADEMSAAEKKNLDEAIAESKVKENLVDHKEVMARFRK